MHMLGGYATTKQSSGMHEFVFQLDSDNQVRLKARQSSQAATWLPEGEGILVFKSDPPDHGPPPIAGLAPDADWERQAVETTVRRWLPLLLGEQGLHAAESEWNDLFASLPSVASQIPSAEHLDWRQLPLVQPLGAAVTGGGRLDNSYMASVDQVENPGVNPLIYQGRSSSVVAKEIADHQDGLRAAAMRGDHGMTMAPVFQTDYLSGSGTDTAGSTETEADTNFLGVCALPLCPHTPVSSGIRYP